MKNHIYVYKKLSTSLSCEQQTARIENADFRCQENRTDNF